MGGTSVLLPGLAVIRGENGMGLICVGVGAVPGRCSRLCDESA